MKLFFFLSAIVTIVPLFVSATWFGKHEHKTTPDHIPGHLNASQPIREHVQKGPDHITVHTEVPIETKVVEIPVYLTATVTATVTDVQTAVETKTATATETVTKTLTDVQTIDALHTIVPTVEAYQIAEGQSPRAVPETEELTERIIVDVKQPRVKLVADENGRHRVHRTSQVVKNSATGTTGGMLGAVVALIATSYLF